MKDTDERSELGWFEKNAFDLVSSACCSFCKYYSYEGYGYCALAVEEGKLSKMEAHVSNPDASICIRCR